MRVATLNIWNSDEAWAKRKKAICNAINRLSPDILGLQEVPFGDRRGLNDYISEETELSNGCTHQYPSLDEGLVIFTRGLITSSRTAPTDLVTQCAVRVRVQIDNMVLGITNVHLDWKSAALREEQIVSVVEWIENNREASDYELLLGDFNCQPGSSVHQFLRGQRSLRGYDTLWYDIPQVHAGRNKYSLKPTLDFVNNPWWHEREKLRAPFRCDWLLLKSSYPDPQPSIQAVGNFATDAECHGLVPSDHYGVYADLM